MGMMNIVVSDMYIKDCRERLLKLINTPIDPDKVRPLSKDELSEIVKITLETRQLFTICYKAVVFYGKSKTVSIPCDPAVLRAFGKRNNTDWESYDTTGVEIPADKIGIYLTENPRTMCISGLKVVLL